MTHEERENAVKLYEMLDRLMDYYGGEWDMDDYDNVSKLLDRLHEYAEPE